MEPVAALVLGYVSIVSVLALAATLVDKGRARRGAPRIRERTLLGLGLVGGSPGLLLGMMLARHKTRKVSFLARAALIVALHVALAAWWLSR